MAKEHEAYRDNYEALLEFFGRNKQLLYAKDVSQFCGVCPRTAALRFDIPRGGITMATLARKMCK